MDQPARETSTAITTRHEEGDSVDVLGAQMRFVIRAEQTAGAWSLMESTMPKDTGPLPHHHPWGEAYYVLEGEVRFEVEGVPRLLGAGDFLYVPASTVHAFRATSEAPARILIFDAPAHSAEFFRAVAREVTELPRDVPKLLALGEHHRIAFVRG